MNCCAREEEWVDDMKQASLAPFIRTCGELEYCFSHGGGLSYFLNFLFLFNCYFLFFLKYYFSSFKL